MKKNFLYFAALTVFAVACSSDDNAIETKTDPTPSGEPAMITETITATYGDASNGTRADINGSTGAFTWSDGDQIAVYVTNGDYYNSSSSFTGSSNSATFTVSYPSGYARNYFALFPAAIAPAAHPTNYGQSSAPLDVRLPNTYSLEQVSGTKSPCPMIATNTGTSWTFKQLCGLLRLSVSVPTGTKKLVITFDKKVTGLFSIPNGTLTPGTAEIKQEYASGENSNVITITDLDGAATHDINIPLPTGTYGSIFITANKSGSTMPEIAAATRNLNGYSALRAHAKKLSTTTLGHFQISDSRYACFSPGNLKFSRTSTSVDWSTGTWSFMPHQYDYVEANGTGNISINYGTQTEIGLFGWGTWAANPSKKPYQTDGTASDYTWSGDFPSNNFEGHSGWRTLSNTEWEKVIGRSSGYHYALGKIHNVCGLILFPDGFSVPSGVTITSYNTVSAGFTEYSDDAWDAMEAAGAVFLPAAGDRYIYTNVIVTGVESEGFYWSSTESSSGTNLASCLIFHSSNLTASSTTSRNNGLSVRLVLIGQ